MKKNNLFKIYVFLIINFIMTIPVAYADDGINLCQDAGVVKAFQVIGYGLLFLKIIIPIVLVIMGSLELGKAVIASDDKAIRTAVMSFVKKVIAGVIVFFVPTIIGAVINLAGNIKADTSQFECLSNCINHPTNKAQCIIPSNTLFTE